MMGLFVLDLAVPQTQETLVTTAIANLELYLEESKGEGHEYDYLLDMAAAFIERAKGKDNE